MERVLDRFRHVQFFDHQVAAPSATCCGPPRSIGTRYPAAATPAVLEPHVVDFLTWVLSRAGVEFHNYRRTALARRLRACLRSVHAESIEAARATLTQDPQQMTASISALLIGVTGFFRDPKVFQYLDAVVLPAMAAERRNLQVWSAGCADGAELYSVAMLLAEHRLLDRSYLLGTDCRADALQHARRGWFDARCQTDRLSDTLRESYFHRAGHGWQICEAIRQTTHWAQGDLLSDSPPAETGGGLAPASTREDLSVSAMTDRDRPGAVPPRIRTATLPGAPQWDIVLCRNVAMYFEPSAATTLWTRLTGNLREGGILVTGKAERPPAEPPWRRLAPCVFQKRTGGKA